MTRDSAGDGARDGLALDEVWLTLGARVLIPPLTLTVRPGTVTTVMGPSGCGKSSLLAYLCGTLDPAFRAGGGVRVDGAEVTALRPEARRLGILFQDDLLFPHMSVGENLAFALPPRLPRRERRRLAGVALAAAALAGFAGRDPATLSGGQRSRVALLRVLLSAPDALLLDEPFNRLDASLRTQFRQTVFEHARRRGLPTLMVTHDPADAAAAAGPVVELGAFDAPADSTGPTAFVRHRSSARP
jgi:putative thiamine transport system ATP-binding protein